MIDLGMRGGIPWKGIPPLLTCSGPRMDGKPAGLLVDREAFNVEETATVTTHQGNFIGEKRHGSSITFRGPGSLSFFHVPSP